MENIWRWMKRMMVNKQLKRGDGDGGVRPGPASQRVICLHTLRNDRGLCVSIGRLLRQVGCSGAFDRNGSYGSQDGTQSQFIQHPPSIRHCKINPCETRVDVCLICLHHHMFCHNPTFCFYEVS